MIGLVLNVFGILILFAGALIDGTAAGHIAVSMDKYSDEYNTVRYNTDTLRRYYFRRHCSRSYRHIYRLRTIHNLKFIHILRILFCISQYDDFTSVKGPKEPKYVRSIKLKPTICVV